MTDQDRLTDAQSALHDIMTGRAVRVVVDQNGERIEYHAANRSGLIAYIEALKMALGQSAGSGPMVFWGR